MTRHDPCKGVSSQAISYADSSASFTTPDNAPSLRWTAVTWTPPRCSASSCAISTMLIAMESSCIVPSSVCKRRDRGLSQADAAIVGRNYVVRPNLHGPVLQNFLTQQTLEIIEQQLILENAS